MKEDLTWYEKDKLNFQERLNVKGCGAREQLCSSVLVPNPSSSPIFPTSKRDIVQIDLSHWSSTYFFIVFPFISHFRAYFSSFIKIKGRIKAEDPVPRSVQRISRYPGLCQLENETPWGNSAWAWPLFLYSWADDVIISAGGFHGGRPGKREEIHRSGHMTVDEGKCHFSLPSNIAVFKEQQCIYCSLQCFVGHQLWQN